MYIRSITCVLGSAAATLSDVETNHRDEKVTVVAHESWELAKGIGQKYTGKRKAEEIADVDIMPRVGDSHTGGLCATGMQVHHKVAGLSAGSSLVGG